jgi:tRNA(Ile)-lysidine synthase
MVAVSGGLDSVTLLHLIRTALPASEVAVAHFDHGWRAASAEDARWVAALAERQGLPFFTALAGAGARGRSHTENDGRTSRYEFFHNSARAWNADLVVTAHHADDQAETVLFRIARGAGTRGLRGIPEKRGIFVRPLLPFHGTDIAEYARAQGLTWREDASNSDARHARNRIRHALLPALEQHAPGTTARLLAISALAGEAERHWDDVLNCALRNVVISRNESSFTLASPVLVGYHHTIRARVLRILSRRLGRPLGRTGTQVGAKFINSGRSGSAVGLARDIWLSREFDHFVLQRKAGCNAKKPMAVCDVSAAIPNAADGAARAVVGGRRVWLRWSMEAAGERVEQAGPANVEAVRNDVACGTMAVTFDPASLRFPLEIRAWHPGDRIRLSYGSKKLKKLFVERRIARSERQRVPVLAESGSGTVLWLAGIARAALADPAIGSPVFRIRVENDDE